jgi:hypothetical protein
MDSTVVRLLCALLAVAFGGVLLLRRRKKID